MQNIFACWLVDCRFLPVNRWFTFMFSSTVVRAYIVGFEYIGNETRYELRIVQSYKNTLALFNQEFVWAPDRCHCPRLKVNGEYIVMGTLVSDSYTRESRLQIDREAFVRKYNQSNHRRVSKLQNTKRICKKFTWSSTMNWSAVEDWLNSRGGIKWYLIRTGGYSSLLLLLNTYAPFCSWVAQYETKLQLLHENSSGRAYISSETFLETLLYHLAPKYIICLYSQCQSS